MSSPFDRRPLPAYLFSSPLTALLYPLHHLLLRLRGPPRLPPPDAHPIRVVCISDTHTLEWNEVPDGDLLIHAGDLCNDGSIREIQAAVDWLQTLPHPHKVTATLPPRPSQPSPPPLPPSAPSTTTRTASPASTGATSTTSNTPPSPSPSLRHPQPTPQPARAP
ncbi:hypothetical protein CNMCM5793_003136 [Aspergillus hiratsukae]|uniref:Calcineurin-like phosphoesterase domain-containing protein n=1 Tax=Aspergillus hiratsukae TaxID=1194566 RepID=A0A8H6PE35_9EURO|nr:hypothetical protein CNMCM5793_003136 [Aspergillus hiratsukae]